jgi:XTP/dITP diphosphohydrolase
VPNNERYITQFSHFGQIEGIAILWYIYLVVHLLVATENVGKKREYEQLLAPLPLELCTPRNLGLALAIQEDGESYAQNARIKALRYMQASQLPTLADDSGLEVDALGGAPGLRSARYAGGNANDIDRYRLLLQKLTDVPWQERTARFRCALILAVPGGEVYATEGACEGMIAFEPEGDHGFGYDPIFYLPEQGQTMAQLPPAIKNRVSHRARAVQQMLPILSHILAVTPAKGDQ